MPIRPRSGSRIVALSALVCLAGLGACGGDESTPSGSASASVDGSIATKRAEPTPRSLKLVRIGGFDGGAVGAAEITGYDAATRRLFVVNGANRTVDVLDLSDPTAPRRIATLSVTAYGSSVTSVAVSGDGVVALAVEAAPKTSPGVVLLYDASDLSAPFDVVTVGALPDMVTFTPDGRTLLVANEGEPNSYGLPDSVDPEGSISVIRVKKNGKSKVETADFRAFIGQEAALRARGVRIFGPGSNAAQDLEPESITVAPDGKLAYVTLQEANAIAIVDISKARVTAIEPLGVKDHSVPGEGLDASNEDSATDSNSGSPAVRIRNWPVKGLYQPDGIASFEAQGRTWLVTANEGDVRDPSGEEIRAKDHCTNGMAPSVFGANGNDLLFDSNVGQLRITRVPNGGRDGKDAQGRCTELVTFGARSFSIWTPSIERVWDSGERFERDTAALPNVRFNASNDNDIADNRSPRKGPEPEGVTVAAFGARTFAFVGLERVGGVMVYDVSDPRAPTFVDYLNTRSGITGDRGPEGLLVIPADRSPTGQPLLVVGHETSGTTAIYRIDLGY